MNFDMRDIALITTMSGAIIFMSFTFPALGLTDDSDTANASDIPNLDLSASQFDIAGDFPDNPGTPSAGTLVWDESLSGGGDDNYLWLKGDTSEGAQTVMLPDGQTNVETSLHIYDSDTAVYEDNYTFNSEGETFSLEYGGTVGSFEFQYTVDYEVVEYENPGQSNFTAVVDYTVTEQTENAGWLARIPVVGEIFDATNAVASIVAWIGSILWWFVTTLFEIALTVILIIVELATFLLSLLQWLVSTYTSIMSAAGSWASVVLAIPLIILLLELSKLGMVLISLLPTT